MVYYKCTETCKSTLKKILTTNLLDLLFFRSLNEKAENICHYRCIKMLNINNMKRNGRWGFCPILGMTEFCSALLSFSNLAVNVFSFKYFVQPYIKNLELKSIFRLQYYIQNMAFIFSTLFHIHENSLTRFLDYSFAVLVLIYALYLSVIRILIIFKVEKRNRIFLRCLFIVYFVYHIIRMSKDEFDYVYNKVSCVLIIGFTLIFHVLIFFHNRMKKYTKNLVIFTFLFFIGGCIELQDIPPYSYILDSHAMWHLFGVLSTPFYMKFWGDDICHHKLMYNSLYFTKRKNMSKGRNSSKVKNLNKVR